MGQDILRKDVYERYLLPSNLANLNAKKIRQRDVHFGCIILCWQLLVAAVVRIYTRRGLMRCLSFAKAMREPDGGISEYRIPRLFILNSIANSGDSYRR